MAARAEVQGKQRFNIRSIPERRCKARTCHPAFATIKQGFDFINPARTTGEVPAPTCQPLFASRLKLLLLMSNEIGQLRLGRSNIQNLGGSVAARQVELHPFIER